MYRWSRYLITLQNSLRAQPKNRIRGDMALRAWHGPTGILWANITPFSLKAAPSGDEWEYLRGIARACSDGSEGLLAIVDGIRAPERS
jgi:hypothetical protein